MEKALEMGKVSATGSLKVFAGVVTSTAIAAVGTIILARLMSPAEYGLYSVALISPMTFSLFRDLGVNFAITKYTAQSRAWAKDKDTRGMIVAGLTFELVNGLALSLVSFFMASFIASTIFHRPESTFLIAIASISIFSGALSAVSGSSFIGIERMGLNSLTMIIQAVAKALVSILLVSLGYSALGAVIGYTFSFLVAGVIGLLMLYLGVLRKLRTRAERSEMIKNLKTMLHYGVPLSISTILEGFLTQFYAFMMAFFCADVLIGNYQVAVNFAVIITFFTTPLTTVLLPAFAKVDLKSEQQLLETLFASSIKYATLVLVPATMAIMILSGPAVGTLFGDKWAYAPFFLTLYVVNNLLVGLGSLNINSFLAGIGETKMLMKRSVLTVILGIPLAFLLIPSFGIVGLIIGIQLKGLLSLVWMLYWIWKHYKAKADLKSSAKIFAASVIALTATYLSLNLLAIVAWMGLIVGGVIFSAVYVLSIAMMGAVNQTDIYNLRTMFSGLGVISKLVNIPLRIIERIARRRVS